VLLLKNFPAFYGTLKFIAVFIKSPPPDPEPDQSRPYLSRRVRHGATILRRTGLIANSDDEFQTLLESTPALRLEKLSVPVTMVSTSAGRSQPYVPAPLRLQVFQFVHDLSNPGTKTTAKLVTQCFVRPGVQKDCRT
jgi:hypothetical protein